MNGNRSFVGLWRALALLPVLAVVSCSVGGTKHYPVTGKLLYKDQPAAGAVVALHPANAKSELTSQPAVGLVKDDGTFTLSTGRDAGVPAGDYIVTGVWYQPAPEAKKKKAGLVADDPALVDKLKGAYADKAKSNLTRQVKPGPNQLEPITLQ